MIRPDLTDICGAFLAFLLCRFYTMSIMMAVDLLGCTGSTEERAALLYKTIQLAAELKSTMGNMFGFAAIMRALELPQVRIETAFLSLLKHLHCLGSVSAVRPCGLNFNMVCFTDLTLGPDVDDAETETHGGSHLVREEAQTFHEGLK